MDVKHRLEGSTIPLGVLKLVSKPTLEGLRYLRGECHVIRTGARSNSRSNLFDRSQLMDNRTLSPITSC